MTVVFSATRNFLHHSAKIDGQAHRHVRDIDSSGEAQRFANNYCIMRYRVVMDKDGVRHWEEIADVTSRMGYGLHLPPRGLFMRAVAAADDFMNGFVAPESFASLHEDVPDLVEYINDRLRAFRHVSRPRYGDAHIWPRLFTDLGVLDSLVSWMAPNIDENGLVMLSPRARSFLRLLVKDRMAAGGVYIPNPPQPS